MPRKATGKVMEDRVWERQRNGTWYCYDRSRVWEGGKARTVSKRLVGKADERGGPLRPTRPKRKPAQRGEGAQAPAVEATRTRTGMCDILAFIGSESGIDEDLRSVADGPTADKLISLARYLVATDGDSLPGIEEWQLTHPVPYGHPITEDACGDLLGEVGRDESLMQGFFAARIAREGDGPLYVALDSTTVDSETRNPEARDGTGESHNGKRTTRVLTLYSMGSRKPLAYAKQPGNVPDVISEKNALEQLRALGAKDVTLVTDVGFASEANLGAILHSGEHALTKARVGWKWVSDEALKHLGELQEFPSIMDCDELTNGITVPVTREFPFTRVHGSKAKGPEAGDTDYVRRRIYLHIYFNQDLRSDENRAFRRDLLEVKSNIERGLPLDRRAEAMRDRYLDVRRRGRSVKVTFRKEAREACALNGVFALAATRIKDPNEALVAYRKREWVEDFFERQKQDVGGHTARTGDPDCLNGRLFVQFLAMCYIEDLHQRLRLMKQSLGIPNGDASHDAKSNLDAEKSLKNWLDKRSLWRTLVWFDAHETVEVSTDITRRRWNTETVRRDRMFLGLLGVTGKVV